MPQLARVIAGPMPGYVSMRSAVIWLQTDGPADVVIEFWTGRSSINSRWSRAEKAKASEDFALKVEIEELEHNTVYNYRVWLNGEAQDLGVLQFHTQKLWQFRTSPPAFTLALGSCAFIVDRPFDRPGQAFGDGYEIFDNIADKQPDLMLWLGDNVYLREADTLSPGGITARYKQVRSFEPLQRLLRATHHIAIWDDHDYGPNNANASFNFKDQTLAAFARYWPNPSFGLPGLPGITSLSAYADVDIFLLDDRFYRDADETPDDESKALYGRAQIQWLKNALLSSVANFKLIAGGSQFWDETSGAEGWHRFPEERAEFLAWFRQAQPTGVVFLSGDRHTTKLCKLDEGMPYPIYEFTCSPLTSQPRRPRPSELPSGVIEETLVDQRNFGLLRFSGRFRSRVMTIEVYNTAGELLWEREIRNSEIR